MKTFILGVGCQKGGTTWLHRQLKKSNNVNLGCFKEYHVFDSIYTPDIYDGAKQHLASLNNALTDRPGQVPPWRILKRLLFIKDVSSYYSYFDYLWARDSEISIVGDITPSYCALKAEHLRVIKKNLESLDFEVKVVFFMRDPVERIWSVVRMANRDNAKKNTIQNLNEDAQVLGIYNKSHTEFRTRYDKTLQNLEQVFSSDNIYCCLYEDLFLPVSIAKLARFIGIDESLFDTKEYFNATEKKHPLSASTIKEVAIYYSSVYNYVGKRFPVTDRWASSRFLGA